jgi:putative ABC transport system ATP-binding protein
MSELLKIRSVCKSYWRGVREVRVLVDVSVEVDCRQIVAVIGSRGEGKTTLLEMAAGLDRPDRGEVWLEDRELCTLSKRDRRRLLGREIRWMDDRDPSVRVPVRDLVAAPMSMGRRRGLREARALAVAALDRVGVGALAEQSWDDISNWERVLVVLAGGIVGSPKLLVIDDLLDGLGPSRTDEAGRLLRSLVDELRLGVLMSVSDWDAAMLADRILNFEGGALTLMSDQTVGANASAADADVLPFERRRDGSRSTNAC